MSASALQASLPMYDIPEVRAATDQWWAGIARHLRRQGVVDVPDHLVHEVPVQDLWHDDRLLLSQCCGFDVVFGHRDRLQVLLTTDWAAAGCSRGHYCSWVVVHEDNPVETVAELNGKVAVINETTSHSGMNALLGLVNRYAQDGVFFQSIRVSGAHVNSLQSIQHKQAEVAAIDCVTFALLQRYRPDALQGIRVLAQTASAPAHPYVTLASRGVDQVVRMQAGLATAFADPALQGVREAILLQDAVFAPASEYQAIADNFRYDPRLLAVVVE